jgi:arylsulfatase A-like enzyme
MERPGHFDFSPPEAYAPTIYDTQDESDASPARLADSRPNIIFILTDDQPYYTIDYMPTVTGVLMAEGVVFENGFVTTPLCCPSRASILTGQYVHNHKVYTNRYPMGGAPKFDDTSSLAVWLREAGYRTAYFGKYLNDYEFLEPYGKVPPGWDDWGAFLGKSGFQYYWDFTLSENGREVEYPKSKANFGADVVTVKAVDFIHAARDEPFFLFVGYYNPHSPYISAPRHKDAFRGSDWVWEPHDPPSRNEKDISDKPEYLSELSPLSDDELRIADVQILRSLLSVDDGVASILRALEQTGLDKNTMIVYLSDNGMTMGEHRFGVTKNCPYDECAHVPFIVYAPGRFPARTDTHLVANIDLAPTFAELAGAAVPESVNGISLVPLLENGSVDWRDALLIEHWPTEEGVGAIIPEFYAVRTLDWKYVEYVTGECELYDLQDDPFELNNLAGKSAYAGIQADLARRLEALRSQ